MREDRVGCLWVVVFITLTFLGVCFLPQPAEALDGCPKLVARWCPPPHETPLEASHSPVERWRPLVAYYWPEWAQDRMMRILACESGGNPEAYNGKTGVRGLFQIHPLWQKVWPGNYYDPWTNASVAYQIWMAQGFGAWVCTGKI